jgi:protein-S-isoprenylcysteine O-methyltransferase Ste14
MKNTTKDRAAVPIPPPLFVFACLAVGILLEFVFPSRPFDWPLLPRILASFILFVISGLCAVGAFRVLRIHHTPFDPSRPTREVVREGPYRFTRNPLYLSLLLLFAAIVVLVCSLWLLLALPVLFFLLDCFAVRREETYLEQKFGDEYGKYKGAVRRWI